MGGKYHESRDMIQILLWKHIPSAKTAPLWRIHLPSNQHDPQSEGSIRLPNWKTKIWRMVKWPTGSKGAKPNTDLVTSSRWWCSILSYAYHLHIHNFESYPNISVNRDNLFTDLYCQQTKNVIVCTLPLDHYTKLIQRILRDRWLLWTLPSETPRVWLQGTWVPALGTFRFRLSLAEWSSTSRTNGGTNSRLPKNIARKERTKCISNRYAEKKRNFSTDLTREMQQKWVPVPCGTFTLCWTGL